MLALTSLVALASVASAHFTLKYPEPRGNSFIAPASQWIYPCANINSSASSNRTLWPLTGGPVAYNSSHDSVFTFINLGLGTGEVSFNVSLTHDLLNVTGKGVFCLPDLTVPSGVTVSEGQNATLQVITVGHSGSSLYNCADIQFSSKAPVVDGAVCSNTTGVSAVYVHGQEEKATNTSENAPAATSGKSSAASGFSSSIASAVTVGLGAIVVSYLL